MLGALARFLDIDRTHGRWPWVAALGAPTSSAILLARRRDLDRTELLLWAPVPAILWHQTEEWVWPGGFLPYFNREVLGGGDDEFPITRRLGFAINTLMGWAPAVAAGAAGTRAPAIGAAEYGTLLANAAIHVVVSARARRWTPGFATSVAIFLPLGIAGLAAIARHPGGGPRRAGAGAAIGVAVGIPSFLGLRLRVRLARARKRRP